MQWAPHPYQINAVQRMLDQPALGLLHPPGLGKTVVVLTALDTFRRAGVSPALVVGPLRVVQQVWAREAAKWDHTRHLRVALLHGPDKARTARQPADVYLLNYDGLRWLADCGWAALPRKPQVLVLDESTALKNHATARFKTLKGLLNHFERRYILTGTPAPNGLHDLWSQVFCLDGGVALGRFVTHFRNTYFTPAGFKGWVEWVPKPGAEMGIQTAVKHLVDRIDYEGHLDMPERVDAALHVGLPEPALQIYQEMEREFILDLHSGLVTAANAAVVTSKLRQITSGALYDDAGGTQWVHTAKYDAVEEYVESLVGQPALVVYEFDTEREALQERLGWPALCGATRPRETTRMIEDWNAGKLPGLLVQPQSAGHGLNLQHGPGRHLLWTSGSWSLELVDQMVGRLWRQGQQQTVIIHRLVVPGTVDEVLWRRVEAKGATQKALLDFLLETYPAPVPDIAAGA